MAKRDISLILSGLSEALSRMTDDEYAMLLRGEGSFRFVAGRSVPAHKSKRNEARVDVKEISVALAQAATREDARRVLARLPRPGGKRQMIEVARHHGVHITTRDTMTRIEEKLIESIVGARIRSDAIKRRTLVRVAPPKLTKT